MRKKLTPLRYIKCISEDCKKIAVPGHAICEHHLVIEVVLVVLGTLLFSGTIMYLVVNLYPHALGLHK